MDAYFSYKITPSKTSEVKKSHSLCITCLEEGYFKVIFHTYYHNDIPEIYAQMLSYCFSYQAVCSENLSEKPYSICDNCISKLRSATEFRKQIQKAQINFKNLFNQFALLYSPEDRKPECFSESEQNILKCEESESIFIASTTDVTPKSNDSTSEGLTGVYKKSTSYNSEEKIPKSISIARVKRNSQIHKEFCPPVVHQNNVCEIDKQKESSADSDFNWEESNDNCKWSSKEKIKRKNKLITRKSVRKKSVHSVNKPIKREENFESSDSETLITIKQKSLSQNKNGIEVQENASNTRNNEESDGSDFIWKENDDSLNPGTKISVKSKEKKKQSEPQGGLYACEQCSYVTLKYSYLSMHLKSHLKEKPILCELCGFLCRTAYKLRIHKMKHSEDKPYACERCTFSSRRRQDLQSHMKIHTNVRPYTCEKCGSSFRRSAHLRKHKTMHDRNGRNYKGVRKIKSQSEKYVCNICDKAFDEIIDCRMHKVTEHDAEIVRNTAATKVEMAELSHFCNTCQKAFKTSGCLKRHQVAHSEERPFACTQCTARFKIKGSLTAHSLSHSTEKPFTCKLCPFASARLCELRDHFRTHSDSRPFTCPFCPQKFRQNNHLKQHLPVHSEEKPYICNLCGLRYKRTLDLKLHMLVHNAARLSCSSCEYTCVQKRQLRKHLLKHTDGKTSEVLK